MAYSVNWTTKVISVPTEDLVPVSGEHYTLYMSDFHKEIRRLEWAFGEGLASLQVLDHTNPKTIAGTVYAAFDEVINDYTVQFTGTAERVDLVGSNNNIVDTLIFTGVSVVPSNSAGSVIFGYTGTDTSAPVWSNTTGITNAYQNGDSINIAWGHAEDANPVLYNIYISQFQESLFNEGNLLDREAGYTYNIKGESTQDLQDGMEYFIGVRATDVIDGNPTNEDTNTNNTSVTYFAPSGSLTQEQNDTLMLTKYQNKAIYIDTEALTNGDGSSTSPFDNVADTTDFAELNGIKEVYVYADVLIDRNVKNFTVHGIGTPVVETQGFNLKNTEFKGVELRGTYTDSIKAEKCILGDNFELNGGFSNCSIMNRITCIDGGKVTLHNCFSNIINDGVTNLSLNGIGSSQVSVINFDGDLVVKDVNNALDLVYISMDNGRLTIDSSCTDGRIIVNGQVNYQDNSNGTIIEEEGLLDPTPLPGSPVYGETK